MSAKRILVLGGGFAGLWSALGAVRKLDELGHGPDAVEVTLVNRDAFHSIRVRNYEADLTSIRVPLDDVLGPVGVRRIEGEVAGIDLAGQTVSVQTASGPKTLFYDRLVFAPRQPAPPAKHRRPGRTCLRRRHLRRCGQAQRPSSVAAQPSGNPGTVHGHCGGRGLTGIEAATEMPGRLRAVVAQAKPTRPCRVILADHKPFVGSDMGESARPVIEEALAELGVETRFGIEVVSIDGAGIMLMSGEGDARGDGGLVRRHASQPAHPAVPGRMRLFGRLPVDEFMRLKGVPGVFAAGDVAWSMMDDRHASVMSCQHGRPMGRFAGHNVASDLFGLPLLPLRIDWYVTVLDLGPWGAVYTEGWDRHVVTKGEVGKEDQADNQLPSDLSAVDPQPPGNPRRRRSDGSKATRELPLKTPDAMRGATAGTGRVFQAQFGHPTRLA